MAHHQAEVLVLTLYSGENEFERCRDALTGQSFTAWDHRVFENLPNVEAHGRLYETVMAERDRYRLFFKLDADMVLADSEVLADLVRVFGEHPSLDHLVVAVSDWMTRRHMIGAHLFSRRVRWRSHEETLYVDPDPEFPGDKLVVDRPSRDLVFHADDPSPFQAFHFGAHRALQASQVYRSLAETRPHNARIMWRVLVDVWQHWQDSRNRRLGLAMLAADMVFSRALPSTVNVYSDQALRVSFAEAAELDVEDLWNRLAPRWGSAAARRRTWLRALGPAKTAVVAARAVRDSVAAAVKGYVRSSSPEVVIGGRP